MAKTKSIEVGLAIVRERNAKKI